MMWRRHLNKYVKWLPVFFGLWVINEMIAGRFDDWRSTHWTFPSNLFTFQIRSVRRMVSLPVRVNGILANETFYERKYSLFHGDRSSETTVKCIGPVRNRSCLYKNLYYTNKTFWMLTTRHSKISFAPVRVGAFVSFEFLPEHRTFLSYEELETFFYNQVHPIVLPNVTVYFEQPWLENIGHALFDGLYPAYIALIRFAPKHLHRFRLLVYAPSTRCQDCWSEDVYSRFAGLGSMMLPNLEALSLSGWFVFEELLVGTGKMCQRCLQPNLQLPGGVELDGSRLFRDRMYATHGLQHPVVRHNHSAEQRNVSLPLNALVIDNKRFTSRDKSEIHAAIDEINDDTRIRRNTMTWDQTDSKQPLIQITYLDFRLLVSDAESIRKQFVSHLQFMSTADIHVAGPGTGQMYQSFLPDGSVHINLGGVRLASDRNISMNFTSFLEQYMTAGTPYIKGLYYSISTRPLGINRGDIVKLVRDAAQLIMRGFSLPVNARENLAPDGQLFTEMCSLDRQFCASVTERLAGVEQVCSETWPEDIVYEYQQWAPNALTDQNQTIQCPLNRTLLHVLRQKYGLAD